ncbi:MAG: S-adenosylmethionine:tRNA ribosyltransferase-isomerase [Cyclobacteriaceae bacterium]|nr:S-adenosylmethionine:tRNA ribosyltransferase-isomerase [Cyclobacteriaceae bacterium HetDA_MAG_MS6]
MDINSVDPSKFTYELPQEKIAKHPLDDRSASKLLYYQNKGITHHRFADITSIIPPSATLFFNDTKVIPARLIFFKETGAKIEVFLLEPKSPTSVIESAMSSTADSTWRCMIGNAKKWKVGTSLTQSISGTLDLIATRTSENEVLLSWSNGLSFSEVLKLSGKVPLPPYINREPAESDVPRYQTVYSKYDGAVAAPTAGLHFTNDILSKLEQRGALLDYLTLHVSAGTFQPMTAQKVADHPMHQEQIVVTKSNLKNLLAGGPIYAVGTTSMRTLESIYWYGVRIAEGNRDFFIEKLEPYQERRELPTMQEAVRHVLCYFEENDLESHLGHTEIFIFPGYDFKVCDGLVTNFHLPGSTLMLLVAAFVGDDWQNIYKEALTNDYRFLSYGDSSLLVRGH